MKRREFFEKAGIGSAAFVSLPVLGDAAASRAHGSPHDHEPISGPLASATVSFGQWQSDPPFDRFPSNNDRTRNHHTLTPFEVTIKAGGAVNFIIAGFHLVLVYGDGTQPGDIDTTNTILPTVLPPPPTPPGPPLINDPANRIYRGLDPSARGGVQDRVEVVHFPNPGTYLVICGVLPHFLGGMIGYVRVLP